MEELYKYIDDQIMLHEHNGDTSQRVNVFNLFGNTPQSMQTISALIDTTGSAYSYIIAPMDGTVASVGFSAASALAANDTNYVTFSVTNLGASGTGTTAILAASDINTTKATGGQAIVANVNINFTLTSAINDTLVRAGDRLLVKAIATGTLANTVIYPTYIIKFT